MKVVKFRSPDLAERIQEYFPNISTVNDNTLIFSKFDIFAFRLAIGLEKLKTPDDYHFPENHSEGYSILPEHLPYRYSRSSIIFYIGIATCTVRPPSLIVANEVEMPSRGSVSESIYHQFQLSVKSDFQPSVGTNEIPLNINTTFILFALFLGALPPGEINERSRREEIQGAACLFDRLDNPREYFLRIDHRDGRSESIRFYPSEASLDISHF